MKKSFITTLFLFTATVSSWAQIFSIDITGGYCAPIASDLVPVNTYAYNVLYSKWYNVATQTYAPVSYGQGGNVAVNLNWFSKNDIGFGLKLNAHFSAPFTTAQTIGILDSLNNLLGSQSSTVVNKAFSFQFIPHISFRHDFRKVSPVLEMGMIIGITRQEQDFQNVYTYTSGQPSDIEQYTQVSSGGAMLGFYSSLGLEFRLSKVVKFKLALNCSVASYSPTQWKLTSYSFDNVNQLPNLYPYAASGTYVKQIDNTVSPNLNEPGQQQKYSIPFSNIGLSIGFAFNFGKTKEDFAPKEKRREREKDKDDAIHVF